MKSKKRSVTPSQAIRGQFTRDGYIADGWVEKDESDVDFHTGSEYFDVDSLPLQKTLIKRLKREGLDPELATQIVTDTFQEVGTELISDYLSPKPSDSWKSEIDHPEELEPEYKKLRAEIESEKPSIPKILQANITFNDKKHCLRLFDQLKNLDEYTAEYDQKADEINNFLLKGNQYTKQQIKVLENTEKRLQTMTGPLDNLKNRILSLEASDSVKGIIYGQYLQMMEHEVGSQTYNALREEIEWSVRLPHNKCRQIVGLKDMTKKQLSDFYTRFITTLDQRLYGMDNIKMQFLHITNDQRSSDNKCGRNMAILGPPGTGKTVIGQAYADALGLPFEKISVGGMDDVSIFKGSDKVWNSATPSIILQIMIRFQSCGGVIMLDEIDKLGETPKGREVQFALLHITDLAHNQEFRDNYLNKYPHDLSKIFFIFNLNHKESLDPALLSRMDVIETYGYTAEEKKIIASNYVLPKALRTLNLSEKSVVLTKDAVNKLVECPEIKQDPGAREIEKLTKGLVGKINMYDSIDPKVVKLPYEIPNFKLPLSVNAKLLVELTKDKINW